MTMTMALKSNSIQNLAWVLPRPSVSKYPGSFPRFFEERLLSMYPGVQTILQPFGGRATMGLRCDLNNDDADPHVICDAHRLPFVAGSIDFVLLDPPYSDEEAADIYDTPPLAPVTYLREAARVCKTYGFVAVYHERLLPRPPLTNLVQRIFVGLRTWHTLRACCVYRKHPCDHGNVAEDCDVCSDKYRLGKLGFRSFSDVKGWE